MDNLKQYLEAIIGLRDENRRPNGFIYNGVEYFILQNGEEMKANSLPERFKNARSTPKECYTNAFQLVQRYPDELIYCEGIGYSIAIPMDHAWCIHRETGELIDPTWKNPETCSYFGVKFSYDYLVQTILTKGTYGLLWNLEQGHPLLRGKGNWEL